MASTCLVVRMIAPVGIMGVVMAVGSLVVTHPAYQADPTSPNLIACTGTGPAERLRCATRVSAASRDVMCVTRS